MNVQKTYLNTSISHSQLLFGQATMRQTIAADQTTAEIDMHTLETFWFPRCIFQVQTFDIKFHDLEDVSAVPEDK